MLKVILSTETRVFVDSKTGLLVFLPGTFNRAKGRKNRNAKIRKPVCVVIDGSLFIFKRKEWAKAKQNGINFNKYHKDLPKVYRKEIEDKVKMSKKLAPRRALRLKLEADAAKEQEKILLKGESNNNPPP